MANMELWNVWAPEEVVWSRWAKPSLFARLTSMGISRDVPSLKDFVEAEITGWAPEAGIGRVAIVADLPGTLSVVAGLSLMKAGWRPVPLFNTTDDQNPLIDVDPLVAALYRGAIDLKAAQLPIDAPPVFLIDENRTGLPRKPAPGMYDNRWVVFPQDFPSAAFLLDQGIQTAILLQRVIKPPSTDLAHVLLRWQQAGIRILAADHGTNAALQPMTIAKPSAFRMAWARLMTAAGLRRNAAGGFGAAVPEQSTSGGHYG